MSRIERTPSFTRSRRPIVETWNHLQYARAARQVSRSCCVKTVARAHARLKSADDGRARGNLSSKLAFEKRASDGKWVLSLRLGSVAFIGGASSYCCCVERSLTCLSRNYIRTLERKVIKRARVCVCAHAYNPLKRIQISPFMPSYIAQFIFMCCQRGNKLCFSYYVSIPSQAEKMQLFFCFQCFPHAIENVYFGRIIWANSLEANIYF